MYRKKLGEDVRCPLEYGLSLMGGKWKSRVVCMIGNCGPMHFTDLKANLSGVADGVLASTLNQLIETELIRKHRTERTVQYILTDKGESLLPVLRELCLWSGSYCKSFGDALMLHCSRCRLYKEWSEG